MKKTLCPFSKPIVGKWCACQYARMDKRCAGKMTCLEEEKYIETCYEMVDLLKVKSRFILGISPNENELTHMQSMKIRCGGLMGMQRILLADNEVPDVLNVIELTKKKFNELERFPFNQIVQDIKVFSHREKLRKE